MQTEPAAQVYDLGTLEARVGEVQVQGLLGIQNDSEARLHNLKRGLGI